MTKQDLENLKKGALTVESVINRDIPYDMDYLKVLQIFIKQQKVISDEETRIFSEEMQKERFELEKDRVYSDQQLERDKLAEEKRVHDAELAIKQREYELAAKRYRLDREKQKALLAIEATKLEIEKLRLEMERETSKMTIENMQSERKFRYVSLAITTVVGLVSVIVPLVVYRKLAYANLKLIYKDEGRPTQDFKDAVRCIKSLTK